VTAAAAGGASDEPLLLPVSHGADEPERATVPFIVAATAAVSGRRAIVIATVDGVTLGLPEVAGTVAEDGMPALVDLQRQLVDGGGELWLCSACCLKRGITGDSTLVDGASIVGAASIVEALASGRAITLA
jgi:predicted peroxiredoxin